MVPQLDRAAFRSSEMAATLSQEEVAKLLKEHKELRARLKVYEEEFDKKHGHKPEREHIKADADVSKDYSKYRRLSDKLDGKKVPETDAWEEKKQALKRSREAEDDSNGREKRGRTTEREAQKENVRPSSKARNKSKHRKRAADGRFRQNTVQPENHQSRNGIDKRKTSPQGRPAQESGGKYASVQKPLQDSFRHASKARPPLAEMTASQVNVRSEDEEDTEWTTPRHKKTHVQATPQKMRSLGLFDIDYDDAFFEHLSEELAATDRKSGEMALRDTARLKSTTKADGADGVFIAGNGGNMSAHNSGQGDGGDVEAASMHIDASTPSKGKARATYDLPEATPSNPHRHGRTPPSSGHHFRLSLALEGSTPSYMVGGVKRKHSVIDLTSESHGSSPASIAANGGMLTPISKPTCSSPSHQQSGDDDSLATPAFLRKQPQPHRPRCDDNHHMEMSIDEELMNEAEEDAVTPSKRRSQPLNTVSFSKARSAVSRFNRNKSRGKSLRDLLLEFRQRCDNLLDEEQREAESYLLEQEGELALDGDDETDAVKGSSSNPYNRKKKGAKRQTRKLNLKPKPAVQHHDSVEVSQSKALMPPPTTGSKVCIIKDNARGEPERKRHRSEAPTVDSCRVATISIEMQTKQETDRTLVPMVIPRAPSHVTVAESHSHHDENDEEGEDAVMLDEASADESWCPSPEPGRSILQAPAEVNTNSRRSKKKSKPKKPGDHHLASNFVTLKNMSRGQKKKKQRQRNRRVRAMTTPVADTGDRSSAYPSRNNAEA